MLRTDVPPLTPEGADEAGLLEWFAASHLHHVGNDSYYGRPFYLEDWQRENIWNPVFGVGSATAGGFVRQYSTALVGEPRDYGKTELICAMVLSEANVHPVQNGQYGIIAYSKEQAAKILSTMKAMVNLDPDLKALWQPLKHEMQNRETGAVAKVFPYSEGALQSWHFNLLVADELHVWRDNAIWNAAVSGMTHVPNSLLLAITTAAEERRGFLWDWLTGTEELTGVLDDPHAYCWWLGADDADDVDDPALWGRLALPSWVDVEQIRAARRRLSTNDFERYILNRFPRRVVDDPALDPADVDACAEREAPLDFDKPFSLAVDGATGGDAFAIVAHQVDEEGVDRWHEWVFDEPGEDGYYDLNQIEQLIAGIAQRHRCPVGIDQSRLLLMAQQLRDDFGLEIYAIRQDNPTMCQACATVTQSIRSHRSALAGCPKTAEHLKNCLRADREPYGTRWTSSRHGQGTKRIDAAIAAAMAKWMTDTMPRLLTFAETGGVWRL